MFVQQVQRFHQLILGQDVNSALAAVAPLVQAARLAPAHELTPAVTHYLAGNRPPPAPWFNFTSHHAMRKEHCHG